jgi:hypothetical protein
VYPAAASRTCDQSTTYRVRATGFIQQVLDKRLWGAVDITLERAMTTPTIPAWRQSRERGAGVHSLVHLRDLVDLEFVWAVTGQFLQSSDESKAPRPPVLVYLMGWNAFPAGLELLWTTLSNSPSVHHVDASLTRHLQAEQNIEGTPQSSIVFVRHAELLSGPVPDIAFQFAVNSEIRSTKRRPYIGTLAMDGYSTLSANLITKLRPKWWPLHPAYDIVRRHRSSGPV